MRLKLHTGPRGITTNRRMAGWLAAATAAVCAAACWAGDSAQDAGAAPVVPPQRRNALIIVLDRVGTGDVGFLGSTLGATPALDALASRGVVLERAYAASPQPSAARAAILTGRWPTELGFEFGVPMDRDPKAPDAAQRGLLPGTPTIGSLAAQAGWTTGFVGSWQMGVSEAQRPSALGFGFECAFANPTRARQPRPGKDDGFTLRVDGRPSEEFESLDDALTACATGFIERERDHAWLLVTALPGVSPPLAPRPDDLEAFPSLEGKRRAMAASLRGLDRSIGSMIDALARTGQQERTVILVIGDVGGDTAMGSSNGDLRGGFGACFEGGVRVPMLLVNPGSGPHGSRYALPASGVDVMPTVLACLGVPASGPSDGVDLLPYTTGINGERPHAELHWRSGGSSATMFSGLKYVTPLDGAPCIFRIEQDPIEAIDASNDSVDAYNMLRERHERWSDTQPKARWDARGELPPGPRQDQPAVTPPDPSKRRATPPE